MHVLHNSAPRRHARILVQQVLLVTVAFFLAACKTTVERPPTPIKTPQNFSSSGHQQLPEQWWRAFDDPQLNQLVEQALQGNLPLRATWDRLNQARAIARREGAAKSLAVDATAGASLEHQQRGSKGQENHNLSLGLSASYELDLWGRIDGLEKASDFELMASAEDLKAAAISLSAEVAIIWYRLIEQRLQKRLIDQEIVTNQQTLELIEMRFRNGRVRGVDLLRQRQLTESTKGALIRVESNIAVLEHALALLLGQPAQNAAFPDQATIPELPALPSTGLPAELIQRRPDVLASYYAIQASSQRVGVAIANQYPRISLGASVSTSGEVRDLFDNWIASLAANAIAPLFDGGERQAEVERTKAVLSERVNNYGQTILLALQDVEDALILEDRQREFIQSLQTQLELATLSTSQLKERYFKGAATYIEFLQARSSEQEIERSLIAAKGLVIEYRITLCRALAGGWQLSEPAGVNQMNREG